MVLCCLSVGQKIQNSKLYRKKMILSLVGDSNRFLLVMLLGHVL